MWKLHNIPDQDPTTRRWRRDSSVLCAANTSMSKEFQCVCAYKHAIAFYYCRTVSLVSSIRSSWSILFFPSFVWLLRPSTSVCALSTHLLPPHLYRLSLSKSYHSSWCISTTGTSSMLNLNPYTLPSHMRSVLVYIQYE